MIQMGGEEKGSREGTFREGEWFDQKMVKK